MKRARETRSAFYVVFFVRAGVTGHAPPCSLNSSPVTRGGWITMKVECVFPSNGQDPMLSMRNNVLICRTKKKKKEDTAVQTDSR